MPHLPTHSLQAVLCCYWAIAMSGCGVAKAALQSQVLHITPQKDPLHTAPVKTVLKNFKMLIFFLF